MKKQVIISNLDEIVFERRNKSYGAFDIRKKYEKNLKKSFAVAVFCSLCLVNYPLVAKWFEPEKRVIENPLDTIVFINPPVIKDNIEPEIPEELPKEQPRSREHIRTFALVEPEVVNDDDKRIIRDLINVDSLLNNNLGLENKDGKDTENPDFDLKLGEDSVPGTDIEVFKEEKKIVEPKIEDLFIGIEPKPVNLNDIKKSIVYNQGLKEMGIQGKVTLRVLIDEDGNVMKFVTIRTPHQLFVDEVSKHLNKLKFVPAIQNNKPVKCWINVPFDFKLR